MSINTLDNRFSSQESSSPASDKEVGLIFFGVIISLLVLGLIIYVFMRKRKHKKSLSTSQQRTSSNFSQLNYDRQQEELKKQTANSSLQTPYITSSNGMLL